MHVGLIGKHDVAGIVEGEATLLDGPTPTTNLGVLLEYQTVLPEVVTRAQTGRTGSEDDGANLWRTVALRCCGRPASVSGRRRDRQTCGTTANQRSLVHQGTHSVDRGVPR